MYNYCYSCEFLRRPQKCDENKLGINGVISSHFLAFLENLNFKKKVMEYQYIFFPRFV